MAFGKKTQVCGIYASHRVDEVEDNVFRKSSRINSTWGGKHHHDGSAHDRRTPGDRDRNRRAFSNVRGVGSLIAFTFDAPETRSRMLDVNCTASSVLALPSGQTRPSGSGCRW